MINNIAYIKVPEFPENLNWLNSSPLILKKLQGKVILVDFWTYSCINCQRTLPYLKNWWEKYSKSGLVIIGVHTPEFEFEKDSGNVGDALKKYSVDWPVVMDNDYKVWNSYANNYWPAKYLIDHKGKIIYTHFGEGNYLETELKIQEALRDAGFKVSDQSIGRLIEEKFEYGQTPELYLGSSRGQVTKINESSSSIYFEPSQIYIKGLWEQQDEYLEHSIASKELEDILILKYRAKKVYLVMESADGKPIKAYITLDGVGIKGKGAGRDVKFDSEDRGYVKVRFATLYNLIETNDFGEHILRISALEKGLRLFAFTFGS